MQHTNLTFQGFDLRVSFYDDGEPAEICNDAGDVQHLFTPTACGEIYGCAWEVINDPMNEADFRRDMELA
jgi:hypothetical protein